MKTNKSRLVAIVSLLLVTGFLLTSLASYFVSRASVRMQIENYELPLTSDNIYSEIQRDLLRPVFISSLMAHDTFLRDWVLNGEQDPDQMQRYLAEIRSKYQTVTSFFVSDQTRTYYHADGILKTVREDAERDRWYFRVRQMTTDYEINIDSDLANRDALTIFVNYRVSDYDGRYIGATGVGLTVTAVKQIINDYQQNYGRSIYFVDAQGLIQLYGLDSRVVAGGDNIFEREELKPLARQILASPGGTFSFSRDGDTVHLNTRYIPEFNWYLLVEKTEGAALRKLRHALLLNLAVCAVITVIVLLLTNATISSYQRRLEKLAATDKLTGIYTRQAFDSLAGQQLKDLRKVGSGLAVILFDVDRFKLINDTYGHVAGDAVLRNIVAVVRRQIRSTDVLYRWGGEEFLLLLGECSLDTAFELAEKIRQAVASHPTGHDGQEIPATISLGVTEYHPQDDEDQMLRRADAALYLAKHKGRNRTERAPVRGSEVLPP